MRELCVGNKIPPDTEGLAAEVPEGVDKECGNGGTVSALPMRLARYSRAKAATLLVRFYCSKQSENLLLSELERKMYVKLVGVLGGCADYLVFNEYYTIDRVLLSRVLTCGKHLLCTFCAIRRGSKYLTAYLKRFETLRRENPRLRPFLLTLTVRNGADLKERFEHLRSAVGCLLEHRRDFLKRGRKHSELRHVAGLVGSYEVTRNEETGLWHPHVHVILLSEGDLPDFPFELRPETRKARNGNYFVPEWEWEIWQREFVATVKDCGLVREWSACTGGDSSIVDFRPLGGADWVTTSLDHLARDFAEVFKYAVKYSTMSPEATVEVYQKLSGCRLIFSVGCFRGVEVPEDLEDDFVGLADLPYVERFYDYLPKVGYNLRWCRLFGMSPARFWRELAS